MSLKVRQHYLKGKIPPRMETFVKEAGWTPASFCTLWKREEALGPVGNRTTILDTSIPWPNHFIEYPGPSCFNYDYKFLV